MPDIGPLIRQRREELGISAADLAAALGVTYQSIWHWEKSSRTPGRDHLIRLSSILRLKAEEVLPPEPNNSIAEQELLSLFQRMEAQDQELVLRMLRGAVGNKVRRNTCCKLRAVAKKNERKTKPGIDSCNCL